MKTLFIIPARGGSKGIPHKNIKMLGGKPLICHAIDNARKFAEPEDICVTTDDSEIIKTVEEYGQQVPFIRPASLATDTCGTYDVLLHAVNFYEKQGKKYDRIVLLQPTSPFRRTEDIKHALDIYTSEIDMVVSVKETSANPYYNCFEEDDEGYLRISKGDGMIIRRQDAPKAWEYNGAVYVINVNSLKASPMSKFKKIKKVEMDQLHSIDLDTTVDWQLAELIISQNLI